MKWATSYKFILLSTCMVKPIRMKVLTYLSAILIAITCSGIDLMRVISHQYHMQINFNFSLLSQTLENYQSAKYLSITISDDKNGLNTFLKVLPCSDQRGI